MFPDRMMFLCSMENDGLNDGLNTISANLLQSGIGDVSALPEIVNVLYGTHTGTSHDLAEQAAEELAEAGLQAEVSDMQSFPFDKLGATRNLLVVISTDGDGEPPLMAEDFFDFLQGSSAPRLDHLHYSVLALGDSCYYRFCEAGRQIDDILHRLGARRLTARVDCDLDYEQPYAAWIEAVKAYLCMHI